MARPEAEQSTPAQGGQNGAPVATDSRLWNWLIAPWLCALLATSVRQATAGAGLPDSQLPWDIACVGAASFWCAYRLCRPTVAGLVFFILTLCYFPTSLAGIPLQPPAAPLLLAGAVAWAAGAAARGQIRWPLIRAWACSIPAHAGIPSGPPGAGLPDIWWRSMKPEWRVVLPLFLVSRLCLTLIGALSRSLLQATPQAGHYHRFSPFTPLDMWGMWDSGWYIQIARHGYTGIPHTAPATMGQADVAFFPLYPVLARWLGWPIHNDYLAGLLISNLCLIGAGILLYRLARLDAGGPAATRAVEYLFVFPAAFVFSAFLTESLFLFLALACFYAARRQRWLLCGAFGCLAALTRSSGLLLLLPALLEYLASQRYQWRRIRPDGLYLLLIPLGTCFFALFCHHLTGDFLAFSHAEAEWGRHSANPALTLWQGLTASDSTGRYWGWLTLIFALVILSGVRRIRMSYWLWALAMILAPLCSGLVVSMPRYLAPVFPFYLICAGASSDDRFHQIVAPLLALVQGCMMVLWATGAPVTM